jgi:hypothetical protein
MMALLIVILICRRVFSKYRSYLHDMLLAVHTYGIRNDASDRTLFDKSLNKAQQDYILYDVWLSMCYASAGILIGMWASMSFGLMERNSVVMLITAVAMGAVITRALLYDHHPNWLRLWWMEIYTIMTQRESTAILERMAQIQKRVEGLVTDNPDHILTSKEQHELSELVLEASLLNARSKHLEMTTSSLLGKQVERD